MKEEKKKRNHTGGRHFTSANAKEMAKRSAEARKEKRKQIATMREWAEIYRDTQIPDSDLTMGQAVIRSVYKRAVSEGDVRCAQFLADLMGETEQRITLKDIPKLIDDV